MRIIHLTGTDYTEEFSAFIRSEQRRSNVMTIATIQPFCKKDDFNLSCYDG